MTNFIQGTNKIVTLSLTNAKGVFKPLPEGLLPTWVLSPANAGVLTPAADGLSAKLALDDNYAGGASVGATVTYSDGDIVSAQESFSVVPEEDTTGTLTFADAPDDAPAADANTGSGTGADPAPAAAETGAAQ